MIEDYYVWATWFEGWKLHNFLLVIGGIIGVIWSTSPIWRSLVVGKEIRDVPTVETPEDETEMSEEMKAFLENLKDIGMLILMIFCFLYLLTFAAVIIAQIVRFAIRVTA